VDADLAPHGSTPQDPKPLPATLTDLPRQPEAEGPPLVASSAPSCRAWTEGLFPLKIGGAESTPSQPARLMGHMGSPLFDNGGVWTAEPTPLDTPAAQSPDLLTGPDEAAWPAPHQGLATILDWATLGPGRCSR
jgi:hypothetical protein